MSLSFNDTTARRARELAEAGEWPEVARLMRGQLEPNSGHAEVRLLYAEALTRTGQERLACEWLQRITPELEREGDRASHRRALNMLGVATFSLGDLDEARLAFATALDLALAQDDFLIVARAANNLGAIANVKGEHEAALTNYRLALPTFQRLGRRRELAETYHNIAITHRDRGSFDEADECERRAIDYASDSAAPRVAAMGRVGRAEIALRRGDPQFAASTASRAAVELNELHDPLNEADAHRLVGAAAAAMANFSVAHDAFARALELARERGHVVIEAETLRDRAVANAQQHMQEAAHADATAACAIFERLGATSELDALKRRFGIA